MQELQVLVVLVAQPELLALVELQVMVVLVVMVTGLVKLEAPEVLGLQAIPDVPVLQALQVHSEELVKMALF